MPKTSRASSVLVTTLILGFSVPAVFGQPARLPDATRTVYKCTVDGRVTYSDEPCLGAKRMDVEPTRGLNKSTGKERIGADVAREHQGEQLAEAVRPITGMSTKQFQMASRRHNLEPASRTECAALDRSVATYEAAAKSAEPPRNAEAQTKLLTLRKRFRELRC